MDISKHLLKSIRDSLDNKGLSIELSKSFEKDYFDVNEEVEKDNIRTYLSAEIMDSHMFLYTFAKMLQNNEIEIIFKENTSEHDKNYLEKLSENM